MLVSIIVVMVFMGLLAIPKIAAQTSQPTSSISGLTYPRQAVIGNTVTISFDVSYSTGQYAQLFLMAFVGCLPQNICNTVMSQGVSSTPPGCNPNYPFGTRPAIIPQTCYSYVSSSGVESFSFRLSFSQPGTYHLNAVTEVHRPGETLNIPGASSVSPDMVLTVCAAECSQSTTQTYESSSYTPLPVVSSQTSPQYVTQNIVSATTTQPLASNPNPILQPSDIAIIVFALVVFALFGLATRYFMTKKH